VKLDVLLPYFTDDDKKGMYDDNFEVTKLVKSLPLSTKIVYAKMKPVWPLDQRDFLVTSQLVRFQDQAWCHSFSVEDEEYPESEKIVRMKIESSMSFLKPNPEIRGYTAIVQNEYFFGGNLPN